MEREGVEYRRSRKMHAVLFGWLFDPPFEYVYEAHPMILPMIPVIIARNR